MDFVEAFYGISTDYFAKKGCTHTAREIAHQPALWRSLGDILTANRPAIESFLERCGDLKNLRIVLTGAGSSAFIGEILAGFLARCGVKCESVHTTDIVSAPDMCLFADIPTLLVSFARSGNSPESEGAVRYARRTIKTLYEVAIVCDSGSRLCRTSRETDDSLVLVMPEGSNDNGFAMTSSVSCMLLAGFALFNATRMDEVIRDINQLADRVEKHGRALSESAQRCADIPFDRASYIGSSGYKGVAHEGSLKLMELSDGAIVAGYDSAAGFRHGPKTVVKGNALSVHIVARDPFTARYDLDLLQEMLQEKDKNTIIAVDCGLYGVNARLADTYAGCNAVVSIPSDGYGCAADLCAGIHGLVFLQMLSMFKSLALGVTTDDPSPTGQVNRVVKGVTIY